MKRIHSLSLLSLPLLFLLASVCFAVVTTSERGNWPDDWPKELEPLRPTSRTIDIATGIQELIYEIPISDRETFDRIWPAILKLRTPGSPLTLYRVDTPPPKAWGNLLSNKRPCVRIYSPLIGYSSTEAGNGDVRQLEDQVLREGLALRTSAPWPPEIVGPNGELPEFVVAQTDSNGRRTWVPGDQDLAKHIPGFYHRARIDVELVVDGQILDLNRIPLPDGAMVIDHRSSLVTVQCPGRQDCDQLLKQWQELPSGIHKKIEWEIAVGDRLGLSSTGTVQLIGVYNQSQGKGDKAKPKRLFHLRQTDLLGERLFWSILVNAEDETYRILFHANEPGEKDASWLKLRDG